MSDRWALLLSGGTALGAVQVPVVEEAWRRLGPPAIIGGVSVGAVNALALADGDVAALRGVWADVDGARWFQRSQLDVWHGLFSLKPLRREIERRGKGTPMRIPVVVGVVDIAAQRYRTVPLADLDWPDRVAATICSATQPGIHERVKFDGRWQAGAALEMLLSRVARDDLRRLRRWAEQVPVVAYAPPTWDSVGNPFDAEPATIRQRLATGEAMLERPVLGTLPTG
jgi:predicted acylesterase/phospholipase RssA